MRPPSPGGAESRQTPSRRSFAKPASNRKSASKGSRSSMEGAPAPPAVSTGMGSEDVDMQAAAHADRWTLDINLSMMDLTPKAERRRNHYGDDSSAQAGIQPKISPNLRDVLQSVDTVMASGGAGGGGAGGGANMGSGATKKPSQPGQPEWIQNVVRALNQVMALHRNAARNAAIAPLDRNSAVYRTAQGNVQELYNLLQYKGDDPELLMQQVSCGPPPWLRHSPLIFSLPFGFARCLVGPAV